MPDLVTLSEAKTKLRIYHDDFDTQFALLISAASNAVVNYLDDRAEAVLDLDSGGEIPSGVEVPEEVKVATLYLVDVMHRDSDAADEFKMGYLPAQVVSLLYPLRDPAIG